MSIVNWLWFLSSCLLSVACYAEFFSLSLAYNLFPLSSAFSVLAFFASFLYYLFSFSKHFCLYTFSYRLVYCVFFSCLLSRVCVTSSFPFVSFIFRVVSWLAILSLASRLVSALLSLLSNLRYLIACDSYPKFGYLPQISCFLSYVFFGFSALVSPILSVVICLSSLFFLFSLVSWVSVYCLFSYCFFLLSYDLSSPPPLPPPLSSVSSIGDTQGKSKTEKEKQIADRREGRRVRGLWGRSHIIRRGENMVLYKSFKTLCFFLKQS
jgi:hypothetical protein